MKRLIDVLGWAGALAILVAYFLIVHGTISSQSSYYKTLNLCGAVGLITNTFYYKAYPSMFVNIFWALVAIYGITFKD